MKILMMALLISGLCACASNDSGTKKPTKKEQCEMLDGPEREGCIRDVDRRQDRERERQKNRVMCKSRLEC